MCDSCFQVKFIIKIETNMRERWFVMSLCAMIKWNFMDATKYAHTQIKSETHTQRKKKTRTSQVRQCHGHCWNLYICLTIILFFWDKTWI